MDKMPPVVRNKFKATMNEQIQEILKDNGAQSSILVRIVDKASNNVMDTLDGKEFVGAFDEAAYE
jgi:hypothetical protein